MFFFLIVKAMNISGDKKIGLIDRFITQMNRLIGIGEIAYSQFNVMDAFN